MTLLEQAKDAYANWDHATDDRRPSEFMADFAESVMPKWTYCEDAMPIKDGWYDVTFESNNDGASMGRCMFENGKFLTLGFREPLHVLAWMPLPEPAVQRDITGEGQSTEGMEIEVRGGKGMENPTKVFKVILNIIDFDDCGIDEIKAFIENQKYPNWCISPTVIDYDERTIDWTDDHPLNITATSDATFREMFAD